MERTGRYRAKRKKYDSSSTTTTDSDSDSENEGEEITYEGTLDPVLFTAEEEEDFRDYYDDNDYYDFSSESDASPSPPQPVTQESDGDANSDAKQLEQARTGSGRSTRSTTRLIIHSHEKLLKFLTTVPDGKKSEMLATNQWNNSAQQVYSLFNITTCIVHPNYFLASENFPEHKVATLLNTLEKRKKEFFSWSRLKKRLKVFLDGFEGFEKLADVFHLEDAAIPLKLKFHDHIDRSWIKERKCWYLAFKNFTDKLVGNQANQTEATFHSYIEALFSQLNFITKGYFPLDHPAVLTLVLPAQKSITERKVDVRPDILVLACNPRLMLVGEVKPFGLKGVKYVEHKGKKVRNMEQDISDLRPTRQTELATDQSQGQGDQLSPTVNEKKRSVPIVTTDEPCASTSKDTDQPRGQGDQLPLTVNEKEKSVSSLTTIEAYASTSRDTDQPRGQGDQLPPTVNEKEKSVPSVTMDAPHASTSKEQSGSSTGSEKITFPVRSLDRMERFKVNKYLPQLFGQMLAVMQHNESSVNSSAFKYRRNHETIQFGFAVEGFKLRFVKLTMIDVLKKEKPTVRALLSGKTFKCHISMTQEFNLLKKHHLEMFYQMLLAMHFLCW